MTAKYDFSGYATKNDIVCADGRTIRKDAFKNNDGQKVPLVWQHLHNDPTNVLGHALLENRADGVYAYCLFNETDKGKQAKMLVQHGDIVSMSIYANQLVEKSKVVHQGAIREVSLVLSGANPGALIENVSFSHSDGSIVESDDEAVISMLQPLEKPTSEAETKPEPEAEVEVAHASTAKADDGGETVEEVVQTMTDKQKQVLYALVAQAMGEMGDSEVNQSNSEGETFMKKNVFEADETTTQARPTLTHSQLQEIFSDAQRLGSLKESFLAHVVTYGIENIDYLFPDAKAVTESPTFVARDMRWVDVWMSRTKHTPFSRIKSLSADLTFDTARALGYIKGNLKKEEFFALAKRVTTPTTIYKKQKLDRDDIIDITDLDVVAWLKREMRMLLDEEIARACLVGDGRDVASEDKINEANIRPVYKDDALYTIRVSLAADDTLLEVAEAIVRARKDYRGSGNPVMFTTTDFLTDLLLIKDTTNRRLYPTMTELMAALRVSDIIEVPILENVTRIDTVPTPDVTYTLKAILLNPADYVIGADKGGQVSMFDDFDIDYNQYKYLLETRMSGALVNPKTAIVFEQAEPPV
jgi:phage head maturation protease